MVSESALWMVIPTAGRVAYLPQLIKASGIPPQQIVIVKTNPMTQIEQVVSVDYLGEFNIQRWWNFGMDIAENKGAKFVAVLNDDTQISQVSYKKCWNN